MSFPVSPIHLALHMTPEELRERQQLVAMILPEMQRLPLAVLQLFLVQFPTWRLKDCHQRLLKVSVAIDQTPAGTEGAFAGNPDPKLGEAPIHEMSFHPRGCPPV